MKSTEILKNAAAHIGDRAVTYDKKAGERSIPATVEAFNAVTGHRLTSEQGWLFMALLKAVRSQQGGYRADSYEDGAAYFALAGEQAAADRVSTNERQGQINFPDDLLHHVDESGDAISDAFRDAERHRLLRRRSMAGAIPNSDTHTESSARITDATVDELLMRET